MSTFAVATTCLVSLLVGPLAAQQPAAAAPAPAPGTLHLYRERVPITDGRLVDADRGMLFVPANRSDSGRGVLGVEVWRFRAEAPNGLPPIFVLPGGPGFEGLQPLLARPGYYERFIRRFSQLSDVVVMGQRGIGASKPNTVCENIGGGPERSRRCRQYWEGVGLDLRGLTVVEAAADVRDAARALGYERIMVWGVSFGSHWGMAVLRFHPELVARAILSGMEGPNHTYDSPTGVLNAIRRVAEAAERSTAVRPYVPNGGLLQALQIVRDRLLSAPMSVTLPDSSTGAERSMRFTVFNVPDFADGYTASLSSRAGAATWPADILRLWYGDFETVARLRLGRAGAGGAPDLQTASYFMLDCSSGITPERLAELRVDPARLLVGDKTAGYQLACPPWDADLGDDFRRNFDTEIPTAIVQGTWDINTPYENALELAPHFRRGKLITVDGGSHGALAEALELDSAFATALQEFLRTGDLSGLPDRVTLPEVGWIIPDDLRKLVTQRVPGRR